MVGAGKKKQKEPDEEVLPGTGKQGTKEDLSTLQVVPASSDVEGNTGNAQSVPSEQYLRESDPSRQSLNEPVEGKSAEGRPENT